MYLFRDVKTYIKIIFAEKSILFNSLLMLSMWLLGYTHKVYFLFVELWALQLEDFNPNLQKQKAIYIH